MVLKKRTIVFMGVTIVCISILALITKSFLMRFFGHVPVPNGPQIIREKENICIDFDIVDPEYTSVALSTFKCDDFTEIDEYFAGECAAISIKKGENPKIIINEDRLCSSFGPCTESRKQDTCHWKTVEFTVNKEGKFIPIVSKGL